MSGGKKQQTVGYRYYFALFMGLGRGPLDAIREIRVGDRTAWVGEVTSSQTINIDAPSLFGGEEKEGGIQGPLDILMGEATQVATPGLRSVFGGSLPGFRRVCTAFFNGLISANNPYPKPWKFRVNRVLNGWDGPVFEPSLAQIPLAGEGTSGYATTLAYMPLADSTASVPSSTSHMFAIVSDSPVFTRPRYSGGLVVTNREGETPISYLATIITVDRASDDVLPLEEYKRSTFSFELAFFTQFDFERTGEVFNAAVFTRLRREYGPSGGTRLSTYQSTVHYGWYEGRFQYYLRFTNTLVDENGTSTSIPHANVVLGNGTVFTFAVSVDVVAGRLAVLLNGTVVAGITLRADEIAFLYNDLRIESQNVGANPHSYVLRNISQVGNITSRGVGANGAHIIYETLTNREWGRGLSSSKLNTESFRLAAQSLHGESFALCMKWLRQDELKNFIQSVLNHVGGVIYTDRTTGLITLKLIRSDYNFDDLEVYDIEHGLLEVRDTTIGSVGRGVNAMTVTWHDPFEDQDRTVTVKNPAAIQSAGGATNASAKSYIGLPSEDLALRVAQRDLRAASTSLRRFTLVADRTLDHLHPGDVIAIRDSSRGIPKTAVRVGKVKDSMLSDGRLLIDVVQDVFALPDASFAAGVPSTYTPPDTTPCIDQQRVFEAPYFMMAGRMTPADLDYVSPDGGYIAAVNSKGKASNVGIQIAVRDGASEPDDEPSNESFFCR